MDEKQTELAKHLAARSWFKWLSGLLILNSSWEDRFEKQDGRRCLGRITDRGNGPTISGHLGGTYLKYAYPDLDDAATQGCLLAMMPDEWFRLEAIGDGKWRVSTKYKAPGDPYDCKGEAIAMALLDTRGE